MMLKGLVLLLAVICIAAMGMLFWERRRMARTFDRLEEMLAAAQKGEFDEHTFDESRLSALESHWKQYLTQDQAAVQSLAKEKAQIKSLIADISHQTKTPIANILLYAQLLAEQPLPPEGQMCVQALNGQAEKLRFLIEALVKMSRLENGIIAVAPQNVPVQLLLEQVWTQIQPRAEAKAIHIPKPSASGSLCCDLRWSAEALYNICDNAVKYSPAGTTVTITAQPYELFCRIDITDQGPGVPEDERSKIFGRFYRGQQVTDQDGVGIGLYLTREIITNQGGYIKVTAQPHQGSTFSVFLPREGDCVKTVR